MDHTDRIGHTSHTSHTRRASLLRLAAVVVALALGAVVVPVSAQDDIDDAREQREEAERAQERAKLELDLLAAEDIEVRAALDAANALVAGQEAKVDSAEQAIAVAEQRRIKRRADVERLGLEIARLREEAREYAVEAYLNVPPRAEELWFETGDPTEGLRRVTLLEIVGQDVSVVLDDLRVAQEDHQAALDDSESFADLIAELEAELEAELVEFEAVRARQAEIKAELDSRVARWEDELAELEAEEARLTSFIQEEEERLARLRNAPVTGIISTTGFVWPTAGGVASGFGPRMHPILGYARMHTGLDIGGAMGQPIWAAKAGTVISAGWNGGYGNTVIVSHGGVATLYAHMSRVDVSTGMEVSTGQQLGAVGSTGLSTGPHLHFETRVNGTPQDPLIFLP